MKAVILAAGIGSRLGDIGKNIPKCLINLGGETILERNIRLLINVGVRKEDIIIVIGGKGEVWTKENQDKIRAIHENIIINEDNVEKNQAYSFWLATKDLNEDVICIDGDSVFDGKLLFSIVNSKYKSCFFTRYLPLTERRMRIQINDNRVVDFGKELNSERVYTPILKFSVEFLHDLNKEILRDKERYYMTSIDAAIRAICRTNEIYNLNIEDSDGKFVNINNPEEYFKALESFGQRRPFIALMSGYTATGKSTSARKIAQLPNTDIFHSAVVRKELNLTPKDVQEADKLFDFRNNAREEMDIKVYGELAERALKSLKSGKNVVLDAGYFFKWQRKIVYDKVKEIKPEIIAIRVYCDDENEIKRRLNDRMDKFDKESTAEAPSWNTYLSTKEVTEHVDMDEIEVNSLKFIEYDTLSREINGDITTSNLNNIANILKS